MRLATAGKNACAEKPGPQLWPHLNNFPPVPGLQFPQSVIRKGRVWVSSFRTRGVQVCECVGSRALGDVEKLSIPKQTAHHECVPHPGCACLLGMPGKGSTIEPHFQPLTGEY